MVNFVLPVFNGIIGRYYKSGIGMNDYLDGILVSRAVWKANSPETVKKTIDAIRENKQKFVIGDCGAFTFFKTKELGFEVTEWQIRGLFDWYDSIGADYGITYDYIVPHGTPSFNFQNTHGKEYIYTLRNLTEMKRVYSTGNWKFKLIGALQFQNWTTLEKAFQYAYHYDYTYVSIGGLVMGLPMAGDLPFYYKVIDIASKCSKNYNLKVHLLGMGRTRVLQYITNLDLNIFSVDSSSSYTSIGRSEATDENTYLKTFDHIKRQYSACHYTTFKTNTLKTYINDGVVNN